MGHGEAARYLEVRRQDLQLLRVRYYWYGDATGAPYEGRVELRPGTDAWSGEAHLRTGYSSIQPPVQEERVALSVPVTAIDAALALLRTAPLVPGEYQPFISHTDDCPELSIALESSDGVVRFRTESQGEEHVPWAAEVRGEEYVVGSPAPFRAIGVLKPHLAWSRLESLIEHARAAWYDGPKRRP